MNTNSPLIFIHGLMSSRQGFKATMLRELFPAILTPDFVGSLEERMAQLDPILVGKSEWTIIGSSFGGLMATLFTCQHPEQVKKLLLLAPALTWPDLPNYLPISISIPTIVYHGYRDDVVPLEPVRTLCEQIFTDLTFYAVDDDHRLRETAQAIDWARLLR